MSVHFVLISFMSQLLIAKYLYVHHYLTLALRAATVLAVKSLSPIACCQASEWLDACAPSVNPKSLIQMETL